MTPYSLRNIEVEMSLELETEWVELVDQVYSGGAQRHFNRQDDLGTIDKLALVVQLGVVRMDHRIDGSSSIQVPL